MLYFDSSHLIVTRGFRVSPAPPHHTLPAFLNLYGRKKLSSFYDAEIVTAVSARKIKTFW